LRPSSIRTTVCRRVLSTPARPRLRFPCRGPPGTCRRRGCRILQHAAPAPQPFRRRVRRLRVFAEGENDAVKACLFRICQRVRIRAGSRACRKCLQTASSSPQMTGQQMIVVGREVKHTRAQSLSFPAEAEGKPCSHAPTAVKAQHVAGRGRQPALAQTRSSSVRRCCARHEGNRRPRDPAQE